MSARVREAPEDLVGRAAGALSTWSLMTAPTRAQAMRSVAAALDSERDNLVPVAEEECHLGEARLVSELKRTTFQLRLFSEVLEEGSYMEATIDHADPDWPPGPRPDLRRLLEPIGPVEIFAASNFPFAFSVAGGDTASALAAGCTVLLKTHPGHPKLSDLTGQVVSSALEQSGAPAGTFSVLHGDEEGRRVLTDPRVCAAAFTGSLSGGRALFDLAASRPSPIPFFGELGSLNPVFVTAAALERRSREIIDGYVGSFTLGAGQFCTKPGLLFVPAGTLESEELVSAVKARPPARLLNPKIEGGYQSVLGSLKANPVVEVLVEGEATDHGEVSPSLLSVGAGDLLKARDQILTECFGPTSILVPYGGDSELLELVNAFGGQLTATVHAEEADEIAPRLLAALQPKAGRIIWNGWPTGVTVCWAMQHGGPYPATTCPLDTSVGAPAIRRFLRPTCYQNIPEPLLPPALQDSNPLGIPQRVDGRLQ